MDIDAYLSRIGYTGGLDPTMLIDEQLRVERPDGTERWPVVSPEELVTVLADRFGLIFPDGTRFGRV